MEAVELPVPQTLGDTTVSQQDFVHGREEDENDHIVGPISRLDILNLES